MKHYPILQLPGTNMQYVNNQQFILGNNVLKPIKADKIDILLKRSIRIEASLGDEEEDDKQEDFNLTKIAEVAGKGLKKLRRNWSIKKDDLSKGLSKIKRSSKNLIEDVYTKDGNFYILLRSLAYRNVVTANNLGDGATF